MSSPTPHSFDVAVIGGGATGYAAALAAARAGLETILCAPPASFPPGRTAALLRGSVDLLESLGAWQHVERYGEPITAIRMADATKRLIRAPEVTFYASEIGLPAFGYNVPNADLVAGLAEAAGDVEGLTVRREPVDAVLPGSDAVTLRSGSGEVEARLVVGADGGRSLARRAADIESRTWSYRQAAIVATFGIESPHRGVSTEFHTEAGPFTLVPLPGHRVSLVWVDRPDRAEMAALLAGPAFARVVEERAASIHGAMTAESAPALVPLHGALAKEVARGRIVLVGEAAHTFPPIGAQGLNLGFRDVEALVHLFARHRADPGAETAVASYGRARRFDIASRTLMVDLLNRSLLTDFLPVQALRSAGLAAAAGIPFARQFLMRRGLGARLPSPG
ncbi:FAD-dependent monooxygenase [Propylenella binzhouense]|uniref:FAD-dependent oxidoreductase n=1 Tax=Propylenella binzhouense TaxID=2555902 RepID=A0A964T6N5_9HYPH|nr:FAD-dependent monooxygenase [Propylenella binzhouense]MYZ49389.1 FAD-dependent oxidoreductase [Propylenella binzhouense]